MQLRKEFIIVLLCLFIFVGFIGTAKANKSVFIISKHGSPSKAEAFSIDGDEVTFQAMVDIDTYNQGYGAVGNAVWPDKDLMFVTYEGSDMIVWSSTKTLQKVGEFDTNVNNLSGITADEDEEKIYIVRRGYDDLYVYSFDDVNNTLVLDNHYDLDVPSGSLAAWGIALDQTNDLLYISTSTKIVHVYDTSDWSHDHSIDISVSGTDRPAVGIAVNPASGCLYTGHWTSHNYLVRTDTTSPYTGIEVEITRDGYSPRELIGVDVDDDTGLVYITTYHNDFRVYDSNLVLKDTERNDDISGPGGVAVGGWYKAALFSLTKDDNDVNCVYPLINEAEHELLGTPYNWLYYNIAWDANGYADSNVIVVDYLPKEVDEPNLISDGGVYDGNEHTVTWDLGDTSANDSNEFQIRVGVNNWARPGGVITNKAVMEGDKYLSWHIIDTNVCAWGSEIIYVDEDANGYNNGTSWDDAYIDLQDGFTGARNCGASVTAIWVAAGTYKPVWDTGSDSSYKNETFELIEDVGLFGHFGGVGTYETSTSQRNFADPNNETILEGQIGDNYYDAVYDIVYADNIDDAIVDGFTITGSYSGSGILLDSSDVSIVNCKFKNNYSYGIECCNFSYPDIHNCTFIGNYSQAFRAVSSSRPEVSYCIFDGNDSTSYGIYMGGYSVMAVSDCVFKKHTNYGIDGYNGTLTVNNSTFDDNPCGLYLIDVTTTITNSSIKNSNYHGLYCSNSDLTVEHSVIANNGNNGLYMTSGCNLTLKKSVVRYSSYEGLELRNNLTTTLTNNWIHNNGTSQSTYYGCAGVYFYNHTWSPLVRNNTIYDNYTYGIHMSENGGEPNIVNCIVYANDSNDLYRENDDFENVNYCNLQNSHPGTGNTTGDPGFKNVATDPNDLHLDETSQCKDAGDPNGDYGDETDIDGENRIYYGRVDMGADEYYWSPADFDEDGTVNFIDYAIFAAAWQSEPNDDNYDEDCDLEDNNSIDFNDLALFCEDWLWEKAWDEGWMMCMGGGGMGFGLESISLESASILESSKTALTNDSDALMLLTATESLETRPERLAAKSQKFYDITPETTILARQKALDAQKIDTKASIKEILNWLDKIWFDGELKEVMTEEQYLEFRKAIEDSLQ